MPTDDSTPSKRCSKCGVEKPATAQYFTHNPRGKYGFHSVCRDCQREYNQQPEVKERKRLRQSTPEYRAIDRAIHQSESYKAKRHARRRSPEGKAKERQYRETPSAKQKKAEREQLPKYKGYFRNWLKNPENRAKQQAYLKDYYRNPKNKPILLTLGAKKRARRRSLPHTFTANDYARMLDYWHHSCCVCGKQPDSVTVLASDHWQPESKGGGFTPDNILPLCHSMKGGQGGCNNLKRNYEPTAWLAERLGGELAEIKLKEIQAYFEWAMQQHQQDDTA